jgi:lipopolysaccharide transport system permease protein
MQTHLLIFREIVRILSSHRQLAWEMTKRRDHGPLCGPSDRGRVGHRAPPHPDGGVRVHLAFVFRQKIGGTVDLPLDYTTYILCGLIPWMSFQESMNKAAAVIVGHSGLVKQVVFPLEILPVKVVIASCLSQVVAVPILIVYVLVTHGSVPASYLLIPVIFLVQVVAMVGMAFLLAAVGTYFRDVKDFVQVFCVIGMYVMPIFYLPAQVPAVFRPVLYLNPFSYMIWCYQDVFYFGRFEHGWAWAVYVTGPCSCSTPATGSSGS